MARPTCSCCICFVLKCTFTNVERLPTVPPLPPRWMLRVTVAFVQPASQQRPHLLQVLESIGTVHHDSSESEEEEAGPVDMQ